MKLGIVGTGMVGSAAAYAIASTRVASSLVLIDHDPALASAQAADIAGAVSFTGAVAVRAAITLIWTGRPYLSSQPELPRNRESRALNCWAGTLASSQMSSLRYFL